MSLDSIFYSIINSTNMLTNPMIYNKYDFGNKHLQVTLESFEIDSNK